MPSSSIIKELKKAWIFEEKKNVTNSFTWAVKSEDISIFFPDILYNLFL